MRSLRNALIGALALVASIASAQAQSRDTMLSECRRVGRAYFAEPSARIEMQFNGQRVDGTYAINGQIYLEARRADFACSYAPNATRMIEFYADGKKRNAYLPGGGPPAGGGGAGIVKVTSVGNGGMVNVRGGPGTSFAIVGKLAKGDSVRNLGCQAQGNVDWCQIEMLTDMRERGWVRAGFLGLGNATQLPGGGATHLPATPPAVTGPGIVQVTGLRADDTLNVRSGPGTGYRVVGALANGTSVRNLGCQAQGASSWCQIEMLTDMRERGWVNGSYLTVGSATHLPATPPSAGAGGTSTVRVKFAPGTSGASVNGTLAPGESRRYLLGARDGQFLTFQLAGNGPNLSYQVFNPDRSFLLNQVPAGQVYQGQLWQSGDHVIEVINRGNQARSYTAVINIR